MVTCLEKTRTMCGFLFYLELELFVVKDAWREESVGGFGRVYVQYAGTRCARTVADWTPMVKFPIGRSWYSFDGNVGSLNIVMRTSSATGDITVSGINRTCADWTF